MINKIVATFDDAVADIADGATVHFGGFASPFNSPSYLVAAVARQGATDLTAISTSMGRGLASADQQSRWLPPELRPRDFFDIGLLAELGRIRKGITSFAVGARHDWVYPFEERLAAGEAEVEVLGQGSLAERIRAARAGIAAFYTPVGPGTDVARGKEVRDFDGVPHVLETALKADFALVRAYKADRYGNLIFRGARTFNETMAGAAAVTIAEVDEVVDLGELRPEQIHTPGVYVQRVVVRPSQPVTSWGTAL
ncbi:MAG: 3-oxoacid CoA-transferase subunit A [Dehalococcoidia bacterium]|nr:3-oxoacid CoA-transferase subunit A [Dehalococcoidia bacterium]